MGTRRDLIIANGLALIVLVVVWFAGWWDAALFGLAVLVVLDLLVLLRALLARLEDQGHRRQGKGGMMSDIYPDITYEQALAAYEAGQKLHTGEQVWLVRRVPGEGVVLWVTDQDTTGDHGLRLYPDGRVEAR